MTENGDTQQAGVEVKSILELHPDFETGRLDQHVLTGEQRARFIDSLRRAGLEHRGVADVSAYRGAARKYSTDWTLSLRLHEGRFSSEQRARSFQGEGDLPECGAKVE